MKKEYLRPQVDYINFYSAEEMTETNGGVSVIPGGGFEEGDKAPEDW